MDRKQENRSGGRFVNNNNRGNYKNNKYKNNNNNNNNNDNNSSNEPDGAIASSSDGTKHRKDQVIRPIHYTTLKNMLEIDHTELIAKLSLESHGFLLLLEGKNIRPDLMFLIFAALARASECSAEQGTVQLLIRFYTKIIPKLSIDANFQRELVLYSANLRKYVSLQQFRQQHIDAVENLLKFLRSLQSTIYQKSFDAVQNIVHQFTSQIEYINRKGNELNDRILVLLAELNEAMENFDQMKAETEKQEVLMEPPEDFRDISIYPSTQDILYDHEPYIRKNLVTENYVGGVDHYLDVQFRLLREDFVRPLRNGISEYVRLKNKADAMKAAKYRIKDLNVYRNVKIEGSKIIQNDQVHLCTFDCTPFRNLRWQYNKRMMIGSLMCLSPDDFKTFFFATVAGQRDPEKLAQGKFQIKLEIDYDSMPEITPLITYVMVESQVYFEAYRHNLRVLQGFDNANFPLERYIVDLNNEVLPPPYIHENTVYQISNGRTGEESKDLSVPILSTQEWPTCTDFNLDESQFEAFRAALTKQIVVIQGPPGTGKTYIGLRIVETLLMNTTDLDHLPILIVCYTNHALDQFLEGITRFCAQGELIRIGGKSQSEILQKSNLSTLRTEMRNNRQVPRYIHQTRFEIRADIIQYQERISQLEQRIEVVKKQFIGDELRRVINDCNPRHYNQLNQHSYKGLAIDILNWLGYKTKNENTYTGTNLPDGDDQSDSDEEVLEEPNEEPVIDEEPVFDEEEIQEIERNRIIDSDWEDEEVPHYLRPQLENQIDRIDVLNGTPINALIDFDDIDPDGFRTVKDKKKLKKQFKREIAKTRIMSLEQAKAVDNINSLTSNQRWDLYRLWIDFYVQELGKEINTNRKLHRNKCLEFNTIRNEEDIVIARRAKIIGMTTTGAAKYRHIVAGVKPKITVVEEAAEVLEAHIVTALCKETNHLILIGDHLQLRPNPAVFELTKKFNLEISLFERLIKNQTDYYQLKQQHRMRPCISSLLVPHIYKQLLDHPSVYEYEDIKGFDKNMFFINHAKNESSQEETKSHINSHEAEFIVELSRHIILQRYEQSQVTILTTYSGQLHLIRQLMRKHQLLNGVRATVVDNYQGEENDIILLSFVRSNEEANIGFLKISNRVNVALSRARKGLYCIGNFDCLTEKSQLWQHLIHSLERQKATGDGLEIYCQNHPDYKTTVSSKDDFLKVPDGGCMLACAQRLPCGHTCPSVCHIIDTEHKGIYKKCWKNCDKIICDKQHRCKNAMVEKVKPQCLHSVKVLCSSNPAEAYCRSQCQKERSCGHKCNGLCSQPCEQTVCNVLIEANSPCDHIVKIKCSNSKNKWNLLYACTKTCGVELKCGHKCKGTCGHCKYGRLHISCLEKCTRILICGHACSGHVCSVDCPPCEKKCENSCVHSKCPLKCGEPCAPCMEKCQWRCDHLKCSRLCSEPCDRQLCELPSTKILRKCGHQSIGVCGEKSPSLCRICDKEKVEEIFFGNEDEEDARFIELEDCKHIIEVTGLIYWMNDKPDSSDGNRVAIQLKKCPKCKTEIRRTKALNTFIQSSLKDVQQVKLKTYGSLNENRKLQRDLNTRTKEILDGELFKTNVVQLREIYLEIFRKTNVEQNAKQFLIELESRFRLVERLKQICLHFEKTQDSHRPPSYTALVYCPFINLPLWRESFTCIGWLNPLRNMALTSVSTKTFNYDHPDD